MNRTPAQHRAALVLAGVCCLVLTWGAWLLAGALGGAW